MPWFIIAISIWGYLFIKDIVRMKKYIESYIELKRIEQMQNSEIRLHNMQVDEKKHMGLIIGGVITLIITGIGCYKISMYNDIYLFIVCALMFVMTIMNLVKSILLYRHGTKCYLTQKGIVAVDQIFGENCKFTLEEEFNKNGNGQKYISVYVRNNPCPYRFVILEREEEVMELVNGF